MLAGVGGRTVEEAQQRVTHAEFVSWIAYARITGGLNASAKMERSFAMLATVTAQMGGAKNVKAEDFLPQYLIPQQDAPIETVFAMLKAKAADNRKG